MNLGLKGRYALVTGGSHGIGRAIALELAREGCHVAVCARTKRRITEVISLIRECGVQGLGFVADVLVPGDIDHVMNHIRKTWGRLDILVNNVGGGGRWGDESVERTEEKVWLDVYEKNALAAVRFTMKSLPLMKKRKWGRIVTISSIYGREGGGRPWFNMAKSAEISLMKTLSMNRDLVRQGITFNSVAPGDILIPETGWDRQRRKNPAAFKKMLQRDLPLGRMGTAEEVAGLVAFLCSEKAQFINGASIVVDGGQSKSF